MLPPVDTANSYATSNARLGSVIESIAATNQDVDATVQAQAEQVDGGRPNPGEFLQWITAGDAGIGIAVFLWPGRPGTFLQFSASDGKWRSGERHRHHAGYA